MLPLQGRSCITKIYWSQDWGGFLNLWGRHHVGGGGQVSIIREVEDNKEETNNNNEHIVKEQKDSKEIRVFFLKYTFRIDFAHKSKGFCCKKIRIPDSRVPSDGFSLLWSLCNLLSQNAALALHAE